MENLHAGELSIEVSIPNDATVRVDLSGRSTDRNPADILVPYFVTLAGEVGRRRASLEVHFEAMQHFNSSTIGAFIEIFEHLRKEGIKHTVVFDGGSHWQRLSFDALKILEGKDGLLEFRPIQLGA